MTILHPRPGSTAELIAKRAWLERAEPAERATYLAAAARALRRRDLEMIVSAGMGHIGGDYSAADIIATLYLGVLRVDPEAPGWPDRDRYIQSKGHASAILYATLARVGFFEDKALDTYMAPLSPLNGHPDRRHVPGVESNTGPLGHGLPVAIGSALAARLAGSSRRTFVLTGDGELQEGSNWEAAMAAAHYGLDNLVAIVDRNGLQQGARTEETTALEPLSDKWTAFGWHVRDVDGHDHEQLYQALRGTPGTAGKPTCIIARTQKGHGVSFMTDRVEWHHKVPDARQASEALEELAQ
jgi:transketolase